MRVGFIGLGNAGGKLAGALLRNSVELRVHDLSPAAAAAHLENGAGWAETPRALADWADALITCLPSPAASAEVVAQALPALGPGKVWMEMSTTDAEEVRRLGAEVIAAGAEAMDCPVSGGCHRAATGNISIFAGGARETFDRILPLLTIMGRQVLHTGDLGSASVLKVVTNFLATAHLMALTEAFTTAKAAGMDLGVTYEAIRISSGNSFVHETEGQVILNGSRDINFTMDLVLKDIGLFQSIAERAGVPLELNPVMIAAFEDAATRYGPREHSPNIVKRVEDATGLDIRAPGFPAQMVDDEPESPGAEVAPQRG